MVKPATANVDSKALEYLGDASLGKPKPLVYFVENGHFSRSISAWGYFSSVNDHALFVETSTKLARVSHAIRNAFSSDKLADDNTENLQYHLKLVELRPQIAGAYLEILQDQTKTIYRALNNNRPAVTNPVLRLLTNIVSFQPSLAVALVDNFDLNLSALPNLLVPPKGLQGANSTSDHNTTRFNFIKFWIALTLAVPTHIRKDLLVNKPKIMNNLWKFMSTCDSVETLRSIIEWMKASILKETNFKRSTKCKILNDNFMFKLQLLFDRLRDPEFTTQFIEFVKSLTSNDGLLFPNRQCLLNTNSGVPVTVNGKTFKLHNKLFYTFLTSLKSFESYQQLSIAIHFLKACPELTGPYLNWCVQLGGGYHDPSLTSWWIGRSLFFTEILKLRLAEELFSDSTSISLLFECICPAPLSKAALTKGIEASGICSQISSQLVLLVLNALRDVLKCLSATQKESLSELVFDSLPEVEQVCPGIKNTSQDAKEELYQLTALKIVQLYEELYPQSVSRPSGFAAISKYVLANITAMIGSDVASLTSYDLVRFNKMLEIQSAEQNELDIKWWAASKDKHSLFTTLIQLCVSVPPSSRSKVQSTMTNLTEDSVIFNEELLTSPVDSLIRATQHVNTKDVHSLLDLALGYAIKAPYKYLDMSHQQFGNISPFIITLFEQFKFNKLVNVMKWLQVLSQELVVIGEPRSALELLWKEFIPEFADDVFGIKFKSADNSFADFILSAPLKGLEKNTELSHRVILSRMDFAALWYVMKNPNTKDDLLATLASKAVQYLYYAVPQNRSLEGYLFKQDFWNHLMFTATDIETEIDPEVAYRAELLNEIFVTMYEEINDTKRKQLESTQYIQFLYETFANSARYSPANQGFVNKFSWILSNDKVSSLLGENVGPVVVGHLFEVAVNRKLQVSTGIVRKVLSGSKVKPRQFESAIAYGLVCFDSVDVEAVVDTIIDSKLNIELLQVLVKRENVDLNKFILNRKDDFLGTPWAISITATICNSDTEQTAWLYSEVLPYVFKSIQGDDFLHYWQDCLNVITKALQLELVEAESFSVVTQCIKKNHSSLAFNAAFVRLLLGIVKHEELTSLAASWLQGILLLVTKQFAELSVQSESFDDIIDSLCALLSGSHFNVWGSVSRAILNTQIEVVLQHQSWVKNPLYLRYIFALVSRAAPQDIDATKLLQIFMNNEMNPLRSTTRDLETRAYGGLIIFVLYFYSQGSTRSLQTNLACLYSGSLRVEDVLLKEILKDLEAKSNVSWVGEVARWELTDELEDSDLLLVSEEPLVKQAKGGLEVTLSKNTLNATIAAGPVAAIPLPSPLLQVANRKPVSSELTSEIQVYLTRNELSSKGQRSTYDPEFIAMMTLCHSEFFSTTTNENGDEVAVFDTKNIIESGVLQILVLSLGNPEVVDAAKAIIAGIARANADETKFKDSAIFKVYLHVIINTFIRKVEIPALIWTIYGSLVPILRNPGHFLYDRAYRFVLLNPTLRAHDIPLFHSITTAQAIEGAIAGEHYYKEVLWLLRALNTAISSPDLRVLSNLGAIEWALDLLNSPYASAKIIRGVWSFMERIQSLDFGNDSLVTKFGALAHLEQHQHDSRQWKNDVVSSQMQLNSKQLLLRFGTSQATKRTREWTNGDNFVKRLCQ